MIQHDIILKKFIVNGDWYRLTQWFERLSFYDSVGCLLFKFIGQRSPMLDSLTPYVMRQPAPDVETQALAYPGLAPVEALPTGHESQTLAGLHLDYQS